MWSRSEGWWSERQLPAIVDVSVERRLDQGEKMPYSGTDPESHITEYSLICADYTKGKARTRP